MPISLTQTASEEDIAASPIRLETPPADITKYLYRQVPAIHHEWFVALYLDHQGALMTREPRVLYLGSRCPVLHCVNMADFLGEARRVGAHALITARHHPHGLMLLEQDDYAQFHAFRLTLLANGTPLYNHLTLYADGTIVSWRDLDQEPAAGGSGTSALRALAASGPCSFMISAACSILMGFG
jgi:hypothetical protein